MIVSSAIDLKGKELEYKNTRQWQGLDQKSIIIPINFNKVLNYRYFNIINHKIHQIDLFLRQILDFAYNQL